MQHNPPLPDLSGLATRLRALPGPISPHKRAELAELHSRLGLLHAQMDRGAGVAGNFGPTRPPERSVLGEVLRHA